MDLYDTRSIAYYDQVFVMGGYTRLNGSIQTNKVQIIDTKINVITVSNDALVNSLQLVGSNIIDNILYAFGGLNGPNGGTNIWQCNSLPSPTNAPTFILTTDSTINPTTGPTLKPTKIPTTNVVTNILPINPTTAF